MTRKRRTYTDEERAHIVLMLEVAGYPDIKGALSLVAKNQGVPAATISRWYNQLNNPAPPELVNKKRDTLIQQIDDLLPRLLDAMGLSVDDAPLREQATTFGILVDKKQLLTGGATENVNHQVIQRIIDERD